MPQIPQPISGHGIPKPPRVKPSDRYNLLEGKSSFGNIYLITTIDLNEGYEKQSYANSYQFTGRENDGTSLYFL
jgi:hypothetical protein